MPAMQEKIERSLDAMAKDLADLKESRIIKTEADREIVTHMQRLVETLRHGEPKTKPVARHHE